MSMARRQRDTYTPDGDEFPFAPRLELFQEGERVRLLARQDCHDPRFRVGGTYAVVKVNDGTSLEVRNPLDCAYSVTISNAEGFRECFPSVYLCRVPFVFGEGLS